MKIEKVKIGEVKVNPTNPRIIKDQKYQKLVQSIKDFPEMLEIRPIVVDNDGIVLGGNMRLKACKEAGLKEIPIIKADTLTEEQKKEFIIKDNVSFGDWDWEILNADWDNSDLGNWGIDFSEEVDINIDEYFIDASGGEEDELKSLTHKVILEYTEEDYKDFQELINTHVGSKEKIILDLLKK